MAELTLAGDAPVQAETVTILADDLRDMIRMIARNDRKLCVGCTTENPYGVGVCPALMHCDAERQRRPGRFSGHDCEEALSEYFAGAAAREVQGRGEEGQE